MNDLRVPTLRARRAKTRQKTVVRSQRFESTDSTPTLEEGNNTTLGIVSFLKPTLDSSLKVNLGSGNLFNEGETLTYVFKRNPQNHLKRVV